MERFLKSKLKLGDKAMHTEDDCFQRYFALQSGSSLPTFQWCLLPPSSRQLLIAHIPDNGGSKHL
jgi:hypothetical protein